MLNEKYVRQLPKWVNEPQKYSGITHDVDALLSNAVLGYDVMAFCDFEGLYIREDCPVDWQELVWVDCETPHAKSISNHATLHTSELAVNLNIFDRERVERCYFNKYAGSTLLTVLAAKGCDISQCNDEQMRVLLAVDSTFEGFYSRHDNDRRAHEYYVGEVLGYPELLELERRSTRQDFLNVIRKYNLKGKIWVNDDKDMKTNIRVRELGELFGVDLSPPNKKFYLIHRYDVYRRFPLSEWREDKIKDTFIFTVARTGKEYVSFNVLSFVRQYIIIDWRKSQYA